MTDPLRAAVEKEMRGIIGPTPSHAILPSDMDWIVDRATEVAVKAILREQMKWDGYGLAEVFRERAEAAERERDDLRDRLNVLEINQDEADECSAELFSLIGEVLEGKPTATAARDKLEKHIKHVRACRKGSCNTELTGSRLRQERDEARRALAEYREKGWRHIWHCDCLPAPLDPYYDPRCAPEPGREA